MFCLWLTGQFPAAVFPAAVLVCKSCVGLYLRHSVFPLWIQHDLWLLAGLERADLPAAFSHAHQCLSVSGVEWSGLCSDFTHTPSLELVWPGGLAFALTAQGGGIEEWMEVTQPCVQGQWTQDLTSIDVLFLSPLSQCETSCCETLLGPC